MSLKGKRIEWKARYDAWRESGQSIAGWCSDQEIKVNQMYYWVQQFEQSDHSTDVSAGTKWLSVQVDEEEPFSPSGQGPILLHFDSISVEV